MSKNGLLKFKQNGRFLFPKYRSNLLLYNFLTINVNCLKTTQTVDGKNTKHWSVSKQPFVYYVLITVNV